MRKRSFPKHYIRTLMIRIIVFEIDLSKHFISNYDVSKHCIQVLIFQRIVFQDRNLKALHKNECLSFYPVQKTSNSTGCSGLTRNHCCYSCFFFASLSPLMSVSSLMIRKTTTLCILARQQKNNSPLNAYPCMSKADEDELLRNLHLF